MDTTCPDVHTPMEHMVHFRSCTPQLCVSSIHTPSRAVRLSPHVAAVRHRQGPTATSPRWRGCAPNAEPMPSPAVVGLRLTHTAVTHTQVMEKSALAEVSNAGEFKRTSSVFRVRPMRWTATRIPPPAQQRLLMGMLSIRRGVSPPTGLHHPGGGHKHVRGGGGAVPPLRLSRLPLGTSMPDGVEYEGSVEQQQPHGDGPRCRRLRRTSDMGANA